MGNSSFADYMGCDDNHNATAPTCGCDNAIDRELSKADDQMKYCHTSTGSQCGSSTKDCKCTCTDASSAASAKYTGMMPVYYRSPQKLGYWYSHPQATECKEAEVVGQKRADGSQCTWKRFGEARVLRGADVLQNGWNASTSSWSHHSADAAQAHQNAQVFRSVFDGRALQPFSCSSTSVQEHVIV